MKKIVALLIAVAFVAVASFAETAKPAASASAAPAAAAAAPAAQTVTGKVVSFTADTTKKTVGTLVVVDSAKKEVSVVVTSTTAITVGKKAGSAKDLAKGKKVTVEYTEAGASKIAL